MNISYQRKSAPLNATCCFFPQSGRSIKFLSPSSKIFKTRNQVNITSNFNQEKQQNQKKAGIQAMKKSISTISLKRKNSEGYCTNRTSLNQSQFVNRIDKRFITHSMDSQVFRQQFSGFSQKNNQINTYIQKPFELIHEPLLTSNNETLESLAQRFKKNRQHNLENNIDMTKKYNFKQFQSLRNQEGNNLKKYHSNFQQNKNFRKQKFETNKHFNFYSLQQNKLQLKNPEQLQSQQLYGGKLQNKFKNNPKYTHIEMNQVDSMIIEVKPPSYLKKQSSLNFDKKSFRQNTNITQSIHLNDERDIQIQKTRKKSKNKQKNLLNYQSNTVHSDYEEDQNDHKKQKIEESAIMINFFNPSSFIRDKLSLSHSRNQV